MALSYPLVKNCSKSVIAREPVVPFPLHHGEACDALVDAPFVSTPNHFFPDKDIPFCNYQKLQFASCRYLKKRDENIPPQGTIEPSNTLLETVDGL
jgi:hypothetical protein